MVAEVPPREVVGTLTEEDYDRIDVPGAGAPGLDVDRKDDRS
jgi:hypothetical protein